jgi:PKD repeat protein
VKFRLAGGLLLLVGACLSANPGIAQQSDMQQGSSSMMGGQGGDLPPPIEFPHLPRITVQPIPTYGTAPMIVGFLVSNSNPNSAPIVSYRWTFGDGTFSTLPPTLFFHTYNNPGSYVITVTGTTADGLNSTGTTGVVVRAP